MAQQARIRERRYGQTRYGDRAEFMARRNATMGSGLPPLSEHEAFSVSNRQMTYGQPHTGGPTSDEVSTHLYNYALAQRNPYYARAMQRAMDRQQPSPMVKSWDKAMFAGLEGELPPLDPGLYGDYGGYGGGYPGYGGYGGYGGGGGGGDYTPTDYGQAVEQEGRSYGEAQQLTLWNI